jgi:hypothetical protein
MTICECYLDGSEGRGAGQSGSYASVDDDDSLAGAIQHMCIAEEDKFHKADHIEVLTNKFKIFHKQREWLLCCSGLCGSLDGAATGTSSPSSPGSPTYMISPSPTRSTEASAAQDEQKEHWVIYLGGGVWDEDVVVVRSSSW